MKRLYETAKRKIRKRFGEKAYESITSGIDFEEGRGSNFFWVCALNEIGICRTKTFDDLKKRKPTKSKTYFDLPELVIRRKESSEEEEAKLLRYLLPQLESAGFCPSPKNPVLLTRPSLIQREDSSYFLFPCIGKNTRIRYCKEFSFPPRRIRWHGYEVANSEGAVSQVFLMEKTIFAEIYSPAHSSDLGRLLMD